MFRPRLRLFVRPSHALSVAVIAGADQAASGGRETKFGQRLAAATRLQAFPFRYLIRACEAKRELLRVLVVLYRSQERSNGGR